MAEAGGEPVDDRRLQSFVIEDRLEDPAGQLRLAAHDLFGLVADAREDRIAPGRLRLRSPISKICRNSPASSRSFDSVDGKPAAPSPHI